MSPTASEVSSQSFDPNVKSNRIQIGSCRVLISDPVSDAGLEEGDGDGVRAAAREDAGEVSSLQLHVSHRPSAVLASV